MSYSTTAVQDATTPDLGLASHLVLLAPAVCLGDLVKILSDVPVYGDGLKLKGFSGPHSMEATNGYLRHDVALEAMDKTSGRQARVCATHSRHAIKQTHEDNLFVLS